MGEIKKLCGARTRRGTSCQCTALANGRCRLHGGLSTGPTSHDGRLRALGNLIQFRQSRVNDPAEPPTGLAASVGGQVDPDENAIQSGSSEEGSEPPEAA